MNAFPFFTQILMILWDKIEAKLPKKIIIILNQVGPCWNVERKYYVVM